MERPASRRKPCRVRSTLRTVRRAEGSGPQSTADPTNEEVRQRRAFAGEFHEYRPHDESACLDIFDSNRPTYFTGPDRDLFAAYLRRMDQPFVVAEVAGEVRGCGGFRVDDCGVAYLERGMIRADWHGRGVGASLLRWRLERIRQVAHAWCVLIDTSQHTAPFFASFGFEAFRTIADGYQPGLDKVFMRLVWVPGHGEPGAAALSGM